MDVFSRPVCGYYYYKHLLHTIQRLNSEQTIKCNGKLKGGVQPPLIQPLEKYTLVYIAMQVYMMTWVERKMAAALFAVPPTATIDEALSHFMEVRCLARVFD